MTLTPEKLAARAGLHQGVLTLLALQIAEDLGQRRLADIDHGFARQLNRKPPARIGGSGDRLDPVYGRSAILRIGACDGPYPIEPRDSPATAATRAARGTKTST